MAASSRSIPRTCSLLSSPFTSWSWIRVALNYPQATGRHRPRDASTSSRLSFIKPFQHMRDSAGVVPRGLRSAHGDIVSREVGKSVPRTFIHPSLDRPSSSPSNKCVTLQAFCFMAEGDLLVRVTVSKVGKSVPVLILKASSHQPRSG